MAFAAPRRAALLLLALLSARLVAPAKPALTGPEVRAFLGGRTGKLAYCKTATAQWQIHYVDFSDSVLTEYKVAEDVQCLSPMISPDGTHVLYASMGGIYIRPLQAHAAERDTIYNASYSAEPHWWTDPATGNEYVIFTTGRPPDLDWPPKGGETYIIPIKNYKPTGAAQPFIPFSMSGGRSKDGRWGCTANNSVGMYRFYPDRIANAFFSSQNWTDGAVLGGCNASLSPSKEPARMNRMMHLTDGFTHSRTGEKFDNHTAVLIRSWDDTDVNAPFWYMGLPGIHCNNDSSGNTFWSYNEWSTDEDYFSLTGSKLLVDWDTADIYVAKIGYADDSKILRVLKGGGDNIYPHLWIKDGLRPAIIQLGAPGLSWSAYKRDTLPLKPETLLVRNAGDARLPPLSLGPLPAWLKVSLVGNGHDTVRLVNTADKRGLAPGSYRARVVVGYGQNADSASYAVSLDISDPVFTRLRPAPGTAALARGDSLRLAAMALDQLGAPMPKQPAISWRLLPNPGLGNLRVSQDGVLRADTAVGGPAWAVATAQGDSGAVRCSVQVWVARTVLRVDAGADKAPAGWAPDSAYLAAPAQAYARDSAISLDSAADPAPLAVYRSYRYPDPKYRIPGLPKGRYRLRLHFATPAPGQRPAADSGTVTIRAQERVLADGFRPPAGPDSLGRAAVLELETVISDTGGLRLQVQGPPGAPAALAGLELYDIGGLKVALLSPNGGDSVHVGQELHVRWTSDTAFVANVQIQVSLDSGASWSPLTTDHSIKIGDPDWGDFAWTVPDSVKGKPAATDRALVAVYDYFTPEKDVSDATFRILPRLPTVGLRRAPGADGFRLGPARGGNLWVYVDGPGGRAELQDLRGRRFSSATFAGPGAHALACPTAPGLYRFSYRDGKRSASRLVTVLP